MKYIKKSNYLQAMDLRYLLVIILILVGAAFVAAFFLPGREQSDEFVFAYVVGVILLMPLLIWVVGRFDITLKKFGAGIGAETTVKSELSKLNDDYTVYHNMPVHSRGDVDFVVVGPTGVIAIEVKGHKFPTHAQVQRFVLQAQRSASDLSRLLQAGLGQKVWVDAVVILPNLRGRANLGNHNGTYVTTLDRVVSYVQSRRVMDNKLQGRVLEILNG
jgi:hypothetical protein